MKQLIPFLALIGLVSAAVAQTSRGTGVGTVTDSSGRVLPAAQALPVYLRDDVARPTKSSI